MQDLTNIQDGTYKLPYDMTSITLTNKQYNPLHVLCTGMTFMQAGPVVPFCSVRPKPPVHHALLQECANILQRRAANEPDDVWLQSRMYPSCEPCFDCVPAVVSGRGLPQRPLHPSDYMNTFHYQTDGWFSQHSAEIYEASTETLFGGRQDAMQRQALVPLSGFMRDRPVNGRGTTMLEVACGTGRLATFVKVGSVYWGGRVAGGPHQTCSRRCRTTGRS